jgi:uncharacterized protein
MRYRLHELSLPLDYQEQDLIKAAARKLRVKSNSLKEFTVIRRSIDARRKLSFIFTVEFTIGKNTQFKNIPKLQVVIPGDKQAVLDGLNIKIPQQPIVIGAGPAGLLAALVLAKNGLKPMLYERGTDAVTRSEQVVDFWKNGQLNEQSNTLYGEGGAGLFSDGKLTARSKDKPGIKYLFETLVECGAPASILIDAEPHLGSDMLKQIVPRLRKKIIEAGGEVSFNSKVEKINVKAGKLYSIVVNGAEIKTDICIMATGHSARDVYRFLADANVQLDQKAFAVGVRMELAQDVINASQWGKFAGHPRLGAAAFRLTRKETDQTRSCYTFCTCPGGLVIACASTSGQITTNGMSLSKRAMSVGNAAFLVPVRPEDYKIFENENYPSMAGCYFQADIEKKAFIAGGSDYGIPAASLSRFLDPDSNIPVSNNRSCAKVKEAEIREILPDFVTDTLVSAIPKMIKGFKDLAFDDVTLYAAETRSSSPVRIKRDENRQSINTPGLFPCGEGAGYAGGIVSSALDGIRVAESIIKKIL